MNDEKNEEVTKNIEPFERMDQINLKIEDINWIEKLDVIQFSEHIADLAKKYLEEAETNKDFFENLIDGDKYFG